MATLAKLATIGVERVSGMSGKRGRDLEKAGIRTVADLLHHVPRQYLDRSRVEPVAMLPIGEEVTVIAEVVSASTRFPRKDLAITEALLGDGTGTFKALWFNQPFREKKLVPGAQVALSGKVERHKGGSLRMTMPDLDVLSGDMLVSARIVPVHPTAGGVSPGWVRRGVHNALRRSRPIPDPVPAEVLARQGLVGRDQAFADVHFPQGLEVVGPARRRLVFDELFRLELALALSKQRQMAESRGTVHRLEGELVGAFLRGLPYRLTGAQERVLADIRRDLAAPHPMHRLLQGEVGSGKTVVAVTALLAAVQGGWQGAVMAPTEVLATQHYLVVTDLVRLAGLVPDEEGGGAALGMESLFARDRPVVRIALLTSSQVAANFASGAGREDVLSWVADGKVDVVIGTHALIQEGVGFARLGMAVVDEQHRFGVSQRVDLKDKGGDVEPDLLIMTATPIPRTLSMTLYGDLDVSIIDELPPARRPVATSTLSRSDEERAWELVRAEARAGRQAFVVCPLVEESEKVEAASATAEHERLQGVLSDLRVGLIHGQLHPREKEAVMAAFRSGGLDVLVATTVIEVGIDVPNATVMVIEDADRFGLSQLHQLRGRVGRGSHAGRCVLLADPATDEGAARLAAMVATNDGFRLAEEDLRIRGQGTVFGNRQSGMPDLRLADILRDAEVLVEARREAFALVDADPGLASHPELAAEVRSLLGDRVEWLFKS